MTRWCVLASFTAAMLAVPAECISRQRGSSATSHKAVQRPRHCPECIHACLFTGGWVEHSVHPCLLIPALAGLLRHDSHPSCTHTFPTLSLLDGPAEPGATLRQCGAQHASDPSR